MHSRLYTLVSRWGHGKLLFCGVSHFSDGISPKFVPFCSHHVTPDDLNNEILTKRCMPSWKKKDGRQARRNSKDRNENHYLLQGPKRSNNNAHNLCLKMALMILRSHQLTIQDSTQLILDYRCLHNLTHPFITKGMLIPEIKPTIRNFHCNSV